MSGTNFGSARRSLDEKRMASAFILKIERVAGAHGARSGDCTERRHGKVDVVGAGARWSCVQLALKF